MKLINPVSIVMLPEIQETLLEKIERLVNGKVINNLLKGTIRSLSEEIKRKCIEERRDLTDEETDALAILDHAIATCLGKLPDPLPMPPEGWSVYQRMFPPFIPLNVIEQGKLFDAKEDGLTLNEAARLAGIPIHCASPYWRDPTFAWRLTNIFRS